MKKIILIIFLILITTGCNSENKKTIEDILKEDNYIIVDVRTKDEYEESHIVDAINIPYDEIRKSDILDKEKTILVYCKSGNRSSIAYDTLKNLGYEVYDLGAFLEIDLPKTN